MLEKILKEIEEKFNNNPTDHYQVGINVGLLKAKEIIIKAQEDSKSNSQCIVCGTPTKNNAVYCSTSCYHRDNNW